jgi:DNA-binding LacI/PurR family transcriptional regulator
MDNGNGGHKNGNGASPRTIAQLAQSLGVSAMTIHRAIAGKPDIAAGTRTRILNEIERLGWRPNIAARGLRQGRTYTLGILVSNVAASFLPEILQAIDRAAEERGYHTFVSVHEHDPARAERHLRTLQSKGVDGIVHYPTHSGAEAPLLNEILRSTPVVGVMRDTPGFDGPSVQIDDVFGGALAARHLLERGHRRFAVLSYDDSDFSQDRRRGFEECVREAGFEVPPAWNLQVALGDQATREAAARIFGAPDRPTALFCTSDRIAARAMQTFIALGVRVPQDVSVVGYNGDAWGQLLPAPLTTIAQPRLEVGERAARKVLDPAEFVASERRVVLNPVLVERESTRPL